MADIVVIGSGAVGLFYGVLLARGGHRLRFLLRRDLETVRSQGVRITSVATPEIQGSGGEVILEPGSFSACESIGEIDAGGPVDWVLVAVKSTDLDAVIPGLIHLARQGARVVVMCNGLGIEERLAAVLPAHRIFTAVAQVCLVRHAPGAVTHQGQGQLLLGHWLGQESERAHLHTIMSEAGITVIPVACVREARWRKMLWNVPFNGLSVVMGADGADTQAILASPGGTELVQELMMELLRVANADLAGAGESPIEASWCAILLERTRSIGPYLTSTVIDYRNRRPLELEALFHEPLRRARRLGMPAPLLTMLDTLVSERAMACGPGTPVATAPSGP